MNVIERVKKILFEPQTEWPVIDAERITTQELYTGYIMPLAAIGPLAMLIGLSTMGMNVPFVGTMRVPFSSLVTQTIVTYVMGLAGIYVLALIINALAPMFSGVGNMSQALKVAAYSATSAWVGGIFNLLPALSFLGLLAAAYTLYLLYLGLPVLMKSPPERAMGYTVTVIIAAVVLFVVIGVVSSIFIAPPAAVTQSQEEPPAVKELEQLGKNLETFTKGLERAGQAGSGARESSGASETTGDAVKAAGDTVKALGKVFSGGKTVEPVDFRELRGLLPESLPSMQRTDATGERSSTLGITVSKAEGRYVGEGHGSIAVSISDIGSMSGLASIAVFAWVNGEIDREFQTGYEKTTKFRGYKAYEKYNQRDRSGEISVLVNQRFVVQAEGRDVDMADLRDVMSKIDLAKLANATG